MLRPLYGVEAFDGETARFEVELSEDDVHGQWRLNGEILCPSAVGFLLIISLWRCDSLEADKLFHPPGLGEASQSLPSPAD